MKMKKRVPMFTVGQTVFHRERKKEGSILRIEPPRPGMPLWYVMKIEFWTCRVEERFLENHVKQEQAS